MITPRRWHLFCGVLLTIFVGTLRAETGEETAFAQIARVNSQYGNPILLLFVSGPEYGQKSNLLQAFLCVWFKLPQVKLMNTNLNVLI